MEEALRQKKAGIRVGLGKEGLLEAGGDGCVIGEFQNGGEQFGGGFGFAGIFLFQQGEHGLEKKWLSPRFEKEGKEMRQIRVGGKRKGKEGNEIVFRGRFVEKNREEKGSLEMKGGKREDQKQQDFVLRDGGRFTGQQRFRHVTESLEHVPREESPDFGQSPRQQHGAQSAQQALSRMKLLR